MEDRVEPLARRLLAALDLCHQVDPAGRDGLDMDEARRVARAIRRLRTDRGERLRGRKIGFTNRTIWDRYNVTGPIWGDMFDTTIDETGSMPAEIPLPALPEPRVEPEIVFGFRAAPQPGMDDAALMATIDWVAHGFEIVTSIFPGWRFTAADCQAAFGLHGALCLGPRMPVSALGPEPARALSALTITLSDGTRSEVGRGSDVLDGPVQALRFLVEGLAEAGEDPLRAGDMVTTGTLTDALPLAPGDRWRTILDGVPLPGLDVTFTR